MTSVIGRISMVMAASVPAATASAQATPPPPVLKLAFEERVDVAAEEVAGEGPRGVGKRIALRGGRVSGRIEGTVVPGGADWQLVRQDGCTEIVADYFLRTRDDILIHVRNIGLGCAPTADRPAYLRANPVFTAPKGRYAWLNTSVFTSAIEPVVDAKGVLRQVVVRFYEVL